MPRNRLADFAREYGLYGLSNRLNDPTSGAGMAVDLIGGLGNALVVQPAQSFHRLLTQGYESGNPQSAEDAFNVAGAAMVGGLAAPKPAANTVGIFGGRLAKTADQAKLAQAEKMAAEGVPREQIWTETGWFRAPDGKWRFEIDDSKASHLGSSENWTDIMLDGPINRVIGHNELYNAYPSISNISTMSSTGRGASWYAKDPKEEIKISGRDKKHKTAIGLHELQHAIQTREGFGEGTSGNNIIADLRGKIDEKYLTNEIIREAYRRHAGEVEARAVEKRMELTPDQRRARPPWLDYDVPEDKQIVRFANGGRPGVALGAAANAPQDNRELKAILDKYGLGALLQPQDWARKMQPGDA